MFDLLIAFSAGAVAAIAAAGLVGSLRRKRRRDISSDRPIPGTDPGLEQQIREESARWAAEQGCPEFAGLAANKLRLWLMLRQERDPRWP